MMRKLISAISFTMVSLACFSAHALDPEILSQLNSRPQASVEADAGCIECLTPDYDSPSARNFRAIREVTTDKMAALAISKVMDHWGFANKCSKFAKGDKFGPWGEHIRKTMTRKKYKTLLVGTPDIYRVCPKYEGFDDSARRSFYVLLLSAMSYAESTCNARERATAVGARIGVGLLTLHENRENTYTPKSFANRCDKGDGKTAEGSLTCGLKMLDGQLTVRNQIFTEKSYWGPLTPQTKLEKSVMLWNEKKQKRERETVKDHAFIKQSIALYSMCTDS